MDFCRSAVPGDFFYRRQHGQTGDAGAQGRSRDHAIGRCLGRADPGAVCDRGHDSRLGGRLDGDRRAGRGVFIFQEGDGVDERFAGALQRVAISRSSRHFPVACDRLVFGRGG